MASRKRLLIDTDGGLDDATAILMALESPDVEVRALTTVAGNSDLSQVGLNVLRVLQVAGSLNIPVFPGCSKPLCGDKQPPSDYHGVDGLGDVPDCNAPDASHLQTIHAVDALIRITKETPGELTLVCIGPLTNVAMAMRMDEEFGKRLKDCYIMGGNARGHGNMPGGAEFNFYCDPEAAYVVLNQLDCPITLVPWEVCLDHTISWAWYEDFCKRTTPKAQFLANIGQSTVDRIYLPLRKAGVDKQYEIADELAMAAAIDQTVVKATRTVYGTVELSGRTSRGHLIVDWQNTSQKAGNIRIPLEFDMDMVKHMMERIGA